MEQLPLQLLDGHLFLEVAGSLWLLDTGAPTSFGSVSEVALAGEQFRLPTEGSYPRFNVLALSQFVGVECAGLLGADVLARFDFLFDVPNTTATISTGELDHVGPKAALDEIMGIPIVSVGIRGIDHRMFLDSGAQISYFQHDSLATFPAAGPFTDFHPAIGWFRTETYNVDLTLAGVEFTLRCGALPDPLGANLLMAQTEGIIGNVVFRDRLVGYFPRRRLLVL